MKGSAKSYRCFTRVWWRRADGYTGRLTSTSLVGKVPYPGAPRRTLARRMTETEAREFCKEWNRTHSPGPLSRKCEYEEE